jgi:hypothetical protein
MTSASRRTPRHWPASGTRRGPASGVLVCTSVFAGECHPLGKSTRSPEAQIPNSRSPHSRFGQNRETGNPRSIPRADSAARERESGSRRPRAGDSGVWSSLGTSSVLRDVFAFRLSPIGPVRPLGDNRKTHASRPSRGWPSHGTDGSQDPGRSGPSLVMFVPELASDGTLHRESCCLLVVLYSPQ